MIIDIIGINIWTNNFNKMSEFYKCYLNLNVHSSKSNWISFEYFNFRLNIGTHSKVNNKNNDSYRTMLNFSTNNIHDLYNSLSKNRVEFIRKPEKEEWGGWVATFYDPDKNILQLLQK